MSSSSLPLTVKIKKFASFRAFLAAVLVCASSSVYSAFVENLLTLNPKANALGNAVTADYVGIDSLQYNPAALINLKPGFSTEFKLIGAPLVQTVRRSDSTLTPKYPEFNLFYRGHTVRCDSAYKPFSGIGIPSSISSNPGRDPVSGGLDPNIPTLNYQLPGDVCFGPELTNPNGVFLDDPLDSPKADLDRALPLPAVTPFYLPNIGYKESEDSRMAFAAQVFSNAPLPPVDPRSGVDVISDLGLQRLTFTPGMAFRITDKLSVGGALRVNKARLQVGVFLDGQNQLFGFLNALVHDTCKTNESRKTEGSKLLFDNMLNCIELYQEHQDRVEEGLARESGYWPFLPWDPLGEILLEGDSSVIYGWNLGVQWQPTPWLAWGATYRTKEDDVYKTKGRVYYQPGVSTLFKGLNQTPVLGLFASQLLDGSTSDKISIDVNVPWPAAFSTGISVQVLEKTKVNIEYRKYQYSDWKSWDATIVSTEVNAIGLLGLLNPNNVGNTLPVPAGGVDTSYWSYGIQQQWNKRLAFRFGLEDRPFLGKRSVVPIYGIKMASVGAEYKLTHDKVVDVSLTSMRMDFNEPNAASRSLASDFYAMLVLRGAEYRQKQMDVNMLIFAASYTHRF